MTCRYPLHPADPTGPRCGAPATTVRIVTGIPPFDVCAEHAAEIDRARGHGPTAEEQAITAKVEAARRAQAEANAARKGGA